MSIDMAAINAKAVMQTANVVGWTNPNNLADRCDMAAEACARNQGFVTVLAREVEATWQARLAAPSPLVDRLAAYDSHVDLLILADSLGIREQVQHRADLTRLQDRKAIAS